MNRISYRSGAAAKLLGCSQYKLRRLHAAGLINAEETPTGQLLFPESEIVRFQKEGTPPIPAPPEDQRRAAHAAAGTNVALRSRTPARHQADRVRESEEEVEMTQNLIEKRELDYKLEEVEDRFREKRAQESHQRANRENAERQRREEVARAQRREEWERGIHDPVMMSLPKAAPIEVRNRLQDALKEVLARYGPDTDEAVMVPAFEAAITGATAPWVRQVEIENILWLSIQDLPAAAKGRASRSDWEVRAEQTARAAVRRLDDNAPLDEVRLEACHAVDRIASEFLHEQVCRKVIDTLDLPGASRDERADGVELVRLALAAAPVGTSERMLRQVAEHALEPLRQRVRLREELESRMDIRQFTLLKSLEMSTQISKQGMETVRMLFEENPTASPDQVFEAIRQCTLGPLRVLDGLNKK